MISEYIEKLLRYGKEKLFLPAENLNYARNRLIRLTECSEYERVSGKVTVPGSFEQAVSPILSYVLDKGLVRECEAEDFSCALADAVMPDPFEYRKLLSALQPEERMAFAARFARESGYVKSGENLRWKAENTKGRLIVTVNTAKPEKDNKATEKALEKEAPGYPRCDICAECEGFGRQGANRQNLRIMPMKLCGENWFWQFSPYMYFREHGIAVSEAHTPMRTDKKTVAQLLDFVSEYPFYFIGCNAALPRVGGSILTHRHFQGGRERMPIFDAPVFWMKKDGKYTGCEKTAFAFPLRGETENEGALSSFYLRQDTCYYKETSSGDEVDEGIADWYNSVICLRSENKDALTERAAAIIDVFENYSDENADIIARSGDKQHNAVSVTALNSGWKFTLYLILRNNRTDALYPEGIFHAHPRYHALKKEAIGLIEAMGYFILPGRLEKELAQAALFMEKGGFRISELPAELVKFTDMFESIDRSERSGRETTPSGRATREERTNEGSNHGDDRGEKLFTPPLPAAAATEKIKDYIGHACEGILCDTAIFKNDGKGRAAFMRFMKEAGIIS